MRPLLVSALLTIGVAQSTWCGFEEYGRLLRQQDPDLELRQLLLESAQPFLAHHRASHTEMACTSTRFVIPVVFHIIYSGASDSISYQRVWNQMLRINEDFRRIPETIGYAGAGTDTEVEFSLATIDPNGNPTTGVVYWRYDQPPLNWTSRDFCRDTQDFSMKQATGWDRNKYLNIWVVPRLCVTPSGGGTCSSCNSVAGYAFYPSTGATQYGSVIGSAFFWGSGNSRSIRTTVHELGHNLNLAHPFEGGCGGTNCSTSGDRVCDTPPTAQNNFSVLRQNTCNNDNPDLPDNPRNIMDYVSDVEMTHFTNGQRARVWSAINSTSSRLYPLTRTPNQAATGTGPHGHVKAYFSAQPRVGCVGQPIRFYSYSLGLPHIYEWDFGGVGGGVPDDPAASCPTVTFSQPGTYTVRLIVQNLSGRRDTLVKTNYIRILDTTYSLPYAEGFEGAAFPPDHTEIDNPDGGRTWERLRSTTTPRGAYGLSPSSMRMLYFSYSRYQERDSWLSPPIDLSPYTDPNLHVRLRFSWAYACLEYENPTATPPSYLLDYTDSLRVYASSDCGATWTLLWGRGGRDLATHPDGCISVSGSVGSAAQFLPSPATWATDSLLLDAYKGGALRLRFEGISGWGNNLYIDDIQVDTVSTFTLSASALHKERLQLYAAEGHLFLYTSRSTGGLLVTVYDASGRLVGQERTGPWSAGHHKIALPGHLAGGLYVIQVRGDEVLETLKYWHSP